jgi:tetratricopeptide (TPR) repeat protein
LKHRSLLLLAATAIVVAACSTPAPPPPAVVPQGEDRFLVDPRIGYGGTAAEAVNRRFDAAWRYVLAGQDALAHQRLTEIETTTANSAPAALATAAIDIRAGRLDEARTVVERIVAANPGYTAAEMYEAEIALRGGDARRAYELYRQLAGRPNAPATAQERVAELEQRLFDQLVSAAGNASESESMRLLREALAMRPAAREVRMTLVSRLVAGKQWEEARRLLEPVVNSGDVDRADVQEALAEIDFGRGRYEEAIARYDRLARRERNPRYTQRLDQIKERWTAANMPPQFQRALESEAITRSDFAVLLHWRVASVRFAQNIGAPPIAIDVEGATGREEIIRALALGIFSVDPVTRRVSPGASVNAGSFTRLVARVLTLRGAACARVTPEAGDLARAEKILTACGLPDPLAGTTTDTPISGRTANAVLEQVDRALAR